MPSRSIAAIVALALALAGSAGCGNLSKNQRQGLVMVGGAAVIVGGTVVIDGWTCDEANWNNASCTHDNGELATGAITMAAGAALLTWALLQMSGEPPASSESARTAKASSK